MGFDISCKLSGDNLHEMSKPIFLEKKKKNLIQLSSAEFVQRVMNVNDIAFKQLSSFSTVISENLIC